MANTPHISIVIPVYNESKRLSSGIDTIVHYFQAQQYSHEIIVINDGSSDNTLTLLKSYQEDHSNLRVITYEQHKGKGYAIKTGVLDSRGDYVLFTDIDLSTPIEILENFLSYINVNPEVEILIGSRKKSGSNITKRQPFIRQKMGEGFTALSKALLGVNVSDFTCGFKLFSGTLARTIFAKQQISGWGFDAEILFLANKQKKMIHELPVTWHNDELTKVNLTRDTLKSLFELFTIRLNDMTGTYN